MPSLSCPQSRPLSFSLAVLAVLALPPQASAQHAVVSDPPTALFGGASVPESGRLRASAPTPQGDVYWTAYARYVDGEIFNPGTGAMDKVRLRAWQGDSTNPDVPFVSPTVTLAPGNTFRLEIVNDLPGDDPSCPGTDVNIPHCFNNTNMHTHGLWVSPTENSDNVLLTIPAQTRFTYEYNIPNDHPAGTFWYHPHLHGSTALQVSSGMAGALIIKGERLPSTTSTGDIDTLLRAPSGQPFEDRVILLQQIQYACRDADGKIKSAGEDGPWLCDPGDVGGIEGYDQFGPGSWPASGRYTTINGLVLPKFTDAVAGQPERWRVIHAGVRDSVKLQFHKLTADTLPDTSQRTQAEYTALISEICEDTPLDQFSMATDGLTRAALRPQTESILHPGYREDLLMVFPEPGLYCVIDAEAPGNATVSAEDKSRKLLGYVEVAPGTPVTDPAQHLTDALVEAAQQFMPADIAPQIIADLQDGLKLAAFEPHPSLMDTTPSGTQRLGFNIDLTGAPIFEVGEFDDAGNLIHAKPYDPDRVDRLLPLGAVQDWELRSYLAGHPFHIHVNPFQVIEILDADGKDVSTHDPDNKSQYAGLKGAWKDTLFVTMQKVGDTNMPYHIRVRTHYQRYIGEFVLHCHILDHEDQGMMQNVQIVLPAADGSVSVPKH